MDTDKDNTERSDDPKERSSRRRNAEEREAKLGSTSPRSHKRSVGSERRRDDVDRSDRSLGKSERRERRDREDREAKDRARCTRESGGGERSERRERRTQEDKEAKERARGNRSSTSERRERRDREDREAKDRARSRRSGAGSSSRPSQVGAFSETDGPKTPRKGSGDRSSRSPRTTKSPSSRRDSERRDKDAKAKSRRGSRAAKPGVESVATSPRSKSDRDGRRRAKEQEQMTEMPVAPNLNADDPDKKNEDEFAVEAVKIDEDAEANERTRQQDEENEKLRQQMQEMADRQRAAEERVVQEKEEAKKRKKRVLCAVLVFVVLVGGVAAYFLTRSSSSEAPSSPGTAIAPTPTSPSNDTTVSPIVNTTAAPTSDLSSNSPSGAPTVTLNFDPPTDADCAAMKNGDAVLNQDDMKAYTFIVGMDVSFSLDVDFENVYVPNLEKAIQEYLAPAMAQCPGVTRRRLRSGDPDRFVIGNAAVSAEHNKDETCKEENNDAVCYRLSVTLQVWLKDDIDKVVLTVTTFVAEAFNKGPAGPSIVELLKLAAPYVRIELVSAEGLDPTNAPTQSPSTVPTATMVPSQTPTSTPSMAPVIGPTTEQPTDIPSSGPTTQPPSSSPTSFPTEATPSPTTAPTKFPTPNPTPNPTVTAATGTPTVTDSNRPTKVPSLAPSETPSESPSVVPSSQPSGIPSSWPSAIPSRAPSTLPSLAPSLLTFPITFPADSTYRKDGPSNYGCFTNGYACYSDACAALDPFPSGNYQYYSETTAYPVVDFDWETNPVWHLAIVPRGWDCSANYCAGPDDCCWDDPLMGGAQVDLTGTPFIFHENTRIQSNGSGTKTRIVIDGTPVLHFYEAQSRLLGVTGGKVFTMNAGGYCGNADAYFQVTLEP